jgi:GNAT superfamily N-acetyltransferase
VSARADRSGNGPASNVSVQVLPCDARGIERFLRVPYRIYRRDPLWVAPLRGASRALLGPRNPFFDHAEMQLFVAARDGEDGGRIAAILDHRHNEVHGERSAFFGFFECQNDLAMSRALFAAATEWAVRRGMNVLRGPVNPSMNEECGLLVEGFDSSPVFMTTYNPAYYAGLCEAAGFRKSKDLLSYCLVPGEKHVAKLAPLVERAHKRVPGLIVRPIRKAEIDAEIVRIKEVYNAAWETNWGFVPWTDAEISFMARRLAPLALEELALLAETPQGPVGFMLSLPDYNEAIKPLKGRLWPFGWLRFQRGVPGIRAARTILLGVKKEYRNRGVDAVMLERSFRWAIQRGCRHLEQSWVLEDNTATRRYLESIGAEVCRTHRIYDRALGPPTA